MSEEISFQEQSLPGDIQTDEAALIMGRFARIAEQRPASLRHIANMYGPPAEAEDIVQQAFLRVLLRNSRLPPLNIQTEKDGVSYLGKTIKNLGRDAWKKTKGEVTITSYDETDEADVDVAAPEVDELAAVKYAQLLAQLRTVVSSDALSALALTAGEDLSHQQAGERLGVSDAIVKARQANALRRIRRAIANGEINLVL
ncbi:MAG: sigma-70 family RNA polymerase sigma factor [Patescibacteria group bacterium]